MAHADGPLAGCVIVVTANRRKRELASALERHGAHVRLAPALTTVPHLDDHKLNAATRELIDHPPDVVVATTGIGFRGWLEAADAAGLSDDLLAILRRARLVARGPKARGAIQGAGLETDWVAEGETAAEVRDYLLAEGIDGLSVAVQHHGAGSDGLDEAFAAAGARVQSLVIYGWGPPADEQEHITWVDNAARGRCDAVLFTSAPAAAAWVDTARREGVLDPLRARVDLGELLLAAVGPITAEPLNQAGLRAPYPERWRLGALVRQVVVHFGDASHEVHTKAGPLAVRATLAVLGGRVLPLSATGLAILRELAAAGGSVVTRERLSQHLPHAEAGGHAIEDAIHRLREAAGAPSLVKTVVKRGYALGVSTP